MILAYSPLDPYYVWLYAFICFLMSLVIHTWWRFFGITDFIPLMIGYIMLHSGGR